MVSTEASDLDNLNECLRSSRIPRPPDIQKPVQTTTVPAYAEVSMMCVNEIFS